MNDGTETTTRNKWVLPAALLGAAAIIVTLLILFFGDKDPSSDPSNTDTTTQSANADPGNANAGSNSTNTNGGNNANAGNGSSNAGSSTNANTGGNTANTAGGNANGGQALDTSRYFGVGNETPMQSLVKQDSQVSEHGRGIMVVNYLNIGSSVPTSPTDPQLQSARDELRRIQEELQASTSQLAAKETELVALETNVASTLLSMNNGLTATPRVLPSNAQVTQMREQLQRLTDLGSNNVASYEAMLLQVEDAVAASANPSGGTTNANPSGGTANANPSGGTANASGSSNANPSSGTANAGGANLVDPGAQAAPAPTPVTLTPDESASLAQEIGSPMILMSKLNELEQTDPVDTEYVEKLELWLGQSHSDWVSDPVQTRLDDLLDR